MKMTGQLGSNFVAERVRRAHLLALNSLLLLLAFDASAQTQIPNIDTDELVKQTVAHELAAVSVEGYYQYRFDERTARGSETRDVLESRGWTVEHLILKNGRPLTTVDQQREERRLRHLLTDPSRLQAFQREQLSRKTRLRSFIAAFPQAFSCEYDGVVQDNSSQRLIRLRFHPNPRFVCRSWELRPLQGLEGTVLIEPNGRRMVRMDARFFRDTDFGGGILGRIDRGGWFQFEQRPFGDNHWGVTTLAMHFNKRVLLASIRVDSVVKTSGFRCVSKDVTLQQGVQRLLEQTQATAVSRDTGNPWQIVQQEPIRSDSPRLAVTAERQ